MAMAMEHIESMSRVHDFGDMTEAKAKAKQSTSAGCVRSGWIPLD
jgi:hypothetical protein